MLPVENCYGCNVDIMSAGLSFYLEVKLGLTVVIAARLLYMNGT